MKSRVKRALVVAGGMLVTLSVILFALGALYRAPEEIPPGMQGKRVGVGELRLRIQQSGAGPDVLLLHGSPGSIEDWEPVARELERTHRVTRLDRPGHGFSDAGASVDFKYNADVALRVIRQFGLHDVTVVGHSFGGSVALALAEANPPEVNAYVVVSTRGFSSPASGVVMRLLALPVFGAGLARATSGVLAERLIRKGLPTKWHPNEAAIPPGYMEERIALWSEPRSSVTTAREWLLVAERKQLSAHYGDIRKPVVLLMGSEDQPNAGEAPRLAGAIAGAQLVMVPGVGHMVQYIRPDLVVQTIRALGSAGR